MSRLPRAALLAVGALVLTACGGGAADEQPGQAAGTAAGTELAFTAPDIRGGQVDGTDYAGQDLVIWFWAPW